MLNNRAIEIIKDLIEYEAIEVKDLAQKYKTTARTIYYDLENINYFLTKHKLHRHLKNGKKIFLKTEEKQKIEELVGNGKLFCSEERKEYLLMKLFFKGAIVLNKEAEILEVNRKTIESDIRDIKREVKDYGVELISLPAKGVSFRGLESGIRVLINLYLVKMLVQKHNLKPVPLELLEEILEFSDEKTLEMVAKKIADEYQLNLSIFLFYTFIAMMITDKMIAGKNMVIENQYDKFFEIKFSPEKLNNFKNFIEINGVKFKEQCYMQLMNLVGRAERHFEEGSYDRYFMDVYKKAEKFLEELRDALLCENSNEISEQDEDPDNKKRLKFLALRFENAMYKHRFGCKENYKLQNEFPKRLQGLYNIIEKISKKYFGELLEEDLEQLTYTTSELINKNQEKRRVPKKVVIVHYNLGILLERDIAKQLSSLWHMDVIKVLPGYELDEFLESEIETIDGIILFEKGYIRRIKTDVPVISLNIFSLEESSKVLFDYGYSKKNGY